jgi:hypothetical protein
MLYYQLIRQFFKALPQLEQHDSFLATQSSNKASHLPQKAFPSTRVPPLYPLMESAGS